MGKKKKGASKKKGAKKPKTPKSGKKPGTPGKKSKKGGKSKKGKGKKSKSPPTTAESGSLGEGPLLTGPALRTYVPEFSGNVYFRSFQVSNPKALLEMSKRHGSTRSKRILGPLKKISAEEHRVAEESAAALAGKMSELEALQTASGEGGVDEASRPTTATSTKSGAAGGGKKKKKKGAASSGKSAKNSPTSSRPSSPQKGAAKKKGKTKGKKKKGGSKNASPANSRPGTSNGGGEGGGEVGVSSSGNQRGGDNFMNDYGDIIQAPPADWSVYDAGMAQKRILRQDVLLAAKGKWVPPKPEELEEEKEEEKDALTPIGGAGMYDENGELWEEVEEEEDPVEKASWILIRGERRFSRKYQLKAETKQVYYGTAGFLSLAINENKCHKYGWKFKADKESMEAFDRIKPELKFGAY